MIQIPYDSISRDRYHDYCDRQNCGEVLTYEQWAMWTGAAMTYRSLERVFRDRMERGEAEAQIQEMFDL